MVKTACTTLTALAALLAPAAASAHFLLVHSGDAMIERPGPRPVKLIFWHPFENGHAMELEKPQAFYMIHNSARTDLLDSLAPITFDGPDNSAAAFQGQIPVRRSGDYVLAVEPAPYYEGSEDIYIQQFTKIVLNRSGLPTDWDQPAGLPTEIMPLNKPYNLLAGSSFTGRVMTGGQPVAGAEIEIEYMAAEPLLEGTGAAQPVTSPPPGGAVVALSDDDGYFTFGIPRAGWWGFAALGVGSVTEHDGKELSQDAVLWVQAHELE